MRRIFSGAGALALAFSLAACGGAPNTADTSGTSEAGAAQSTPALPTAPAAGSTSAGEAYPAAGASSALPNSSFAGESTAGDNAYPGPGTVGASPDSETTGAGVVAAIAADPRFSTLTTLLEDTGLATQLETAGPVTVFAPTNEAFANMPQGALDALGQDPATLQQLLLFHVAPGTLRSADLSAETTAPTLAGEELQVAAAGGSVTINDAARVIEADIDGGDSVVHAIDQVLLPDTLALPPASGG